MEKLAANFAIALNAKDNIIEEKLKEIHDLRQLVDQLKREKELDLREKLELQERLNAVVGNAGVGSAGQPQHQEFSYAEDFDGQEWDYMSIRRSRRKRRPKKLIDVTVLPVRVATPRADPPVGHRKRGRPRIKRENPLEEEHLLGLIEGSIIVNDGKTNVLIDTNGVVIDQSGDSQPEEGSEDTRTAGADKPGTKKHKFPHSCDWPGCERSFRRPAFLRKHKRVHTGEKPFKCTFDGCEFASADIFCLRTHQMRHTGEKPFKCKLSGCGWSGRQQTSFDRHRRVIHGQQRTFHCDWPGCDRRYRDKHSLNYHRKSHTGEKEFMCSYPACGKRFIGRSDMKKHESTHNAIKPYKCSWPGCGRSFVQKRYLALHNLKHTGERPFPCDWPGCEWRSFTPHEQAKHKKTHTGERPYPCERCDRRFADESNLKAHLRTVHEGQKNHKCEYMGCGKKYTVRRTLLIHQMKAHPNMAADQNVTIDSAPEETVISQSDD